MFYPYIQKLRLTNFRNIRHISLEEFTQINFISGDNGVGKTNILDAITRFVSPMGLKNQYAKHCVNVSYPDKGWGVGLRVCREREYDLLTGISVHNGLRIITCDGEKITQEQAMQILPCLWLTPVGEKIFMEDATDIRGYFHTMIGLFFSDFIVHYNFYERACKQRLKILITEFSPDDAWLSALETEIAHHAMILLGMRKAFLKQFYRYKMQHEEILSPHLPRFELTLECSTEKIECVQVYGQNLKSMRHEDKATKRTLFGLHRAKWGALHQDKNIDIRYCSVGEQKSVLLAMLLILNMAFMEMSDIAPVILLDDAFAHFDKKRIGFVHDYLRSLKNNIFLTGTEFHIQPDDTQTLFHITQEMMAGAEVRLF